jgi:hypothetical protein
VAGAADETLSERNKANKNVAKKETEPGSFFNSYLSDQ